MTEVKPSEHDQKIFDILMKEDEITWQSILQDLVKTEQMDPWNVNLTMLSEKFLVTLKNLEKMDFRVSGKMVLASAILLKMKSNRFLATDLDNFDKLVNFVEDYGDEYGEEFDELENELLSNEMPSDEKPELIPRTPQPRKRKVSIYDLVDALEKALEVKKRRVIRRESETTPEVEAPKKKVDINELIKKVQDTIGELIQGRKMILFEELTPSQTKEDKVLTFIPCLHLDNQRHIEINQEQHFGDIEIYLNHNFSKEIQKEINMGKEENQEEQTKKSKKSSKKTKNKNSKKKNKQSS